MALKLWKRNYYISLSKLFCKIDSLYDFSIRAGNWNIFFKICPFSAVVYDLVIHSRRLCGKCRVRNGGRFPRNNLRRSQFYKCSDSCANNNRVCTHGKLWCFRVENIRLEKHGFSTDIWWRNQGEHRLYTAENFVKIIFIAFLKRYGFCHTIIILWENY